MKRIVKNVLEHLRDAELWLRYSDWGAICRAKNLAGGVHPRADCESDALKQVGVKA